MLKRQRSRGRKMKSEEMEEMKRMAGAEVQSGDSGVKRKSEKVKKQIEKKEEGT